MSCIASDKKYFNMRFDMLVIFVWRTDMQSLFSVRLDIDEHLSISFGVISDASGASYGVPEPPSLPDRLVRDSSGSSPVLPSSAGPPYSD